jgi:ribose 5-phosphate isomerase B
MHIAISSDESTELTIALTKILKDKGHHLLCFGALHEDKTDVDWPLCSSQVAKALVGGIVDEAIICCWTGTGACIAANKIKGIRAALVHDAETAKAARIWNHANVLVLSLRSVSIPILKEIIEAWFNTSIECKEAQTKWNLCQIERIKDLDA